MNYKIHIRVALSALLFIALQLLLGMVFMVWLGMGVCCWSMVLSVLCTFAIALPLLSWLGFIHFREAFVPSAHSAKSGAMAFAAAVLAILAIDLLVEQLDLEDFKADEMLSLARWPLGMVVLGLIGPICEELYFREGMLGYMKRHGIKPWVAILISAVWFGLLHANPAQIPMAVGMGVVLGLIYHKTGNILLCTAVHIFNNSTSILEMNILGESIKTFSYEQALGGAAVVWSIIAVAGGASIFLLTQYNKKA